MSKEEGGADTFDWVQIKSKLEANQKTETFSEKAKRKFGENPLIPIGCIATAGCLTYGLICFKRGDSKTSQLMMRSRVTAQGFTILVLIAGVAISAAKGSKAAA